MKPRTVLVLAFLFSALCLSAAPAPPVAIVYQLQEEATWNLPRKAPQPVALLSVLPAGAELRIAPGGSLALALPSGARYRLGPGARATLGPRGLSRTRGPVETLPPVKPFPSLAPIAFTDRPGDRSAAVRVRGEAIEGLSPNESIRSLADRTVLRFRPVHGALRHRVEVRGSDGGLVFEKETEASEASVPAGLLVPGKRYRWTVRTIDRLGPVARGEAWFSTLDAESASSLATEPEADFEESEANRGLVVDTVEPGSAGEVAGLASGDRLSSWCFRAEGTAGCAEPKALKTPFDWLALEMEEVQVGGVRVVGFRGPEGKTWDLLPTLQGLTIRPASVEPPVEPAIEWWLRMDQGRLESTGRRWAEADRAFEEAVAGARASSAIGAQVFILRAWAESLLLRPDNFRAKENLERALALEETRDPGGLGTARLSSRLGEVELRQDRLGVAEAHYRRAQETAARVAPGSGAEAAYSNNLALVLLDRGSLDQAERFAARGLQIRESLTPRSAALVPILSTYGSVLLERGDLAGAEASYLRAAELLERSQPEGPRIGAVLHNLGMIAHFRGDYLGAESFLRRELALAEKNEEEPARLRDALMGLGEISLQTNRPAEAEKLFLRARAAGASFNPEGSKNAWNLQGLAIAQARQGRTKEAAALMRHALSLWKGIHAESWVAGLLRLNLGRLLSSEGDSEAAEREIRAAAALFERSSSPSLVHALHALAQVQVQRGERTLAAESFGRAVEELDDRRGKMGGAEESRWLFGSAVGDLYFEAARNEIALGRPEAAWAIWERGRARGLQELLAQRDLSFSAEVRAVDYADQHRLAAEYDALQGEIASPEPESDPSRLLDLETRMREIRLLQKQVRERIERSSPRLAALQRPEPIDLPRARAALDSGTLMISFAIGASETLLFVIEPSGRPAPGLAAIVLPVGEAALRAEVTSLLALLVRGDSARSEVEALGNRLYDLLIAPAEPEVGRARRLLISPDGPLHLLPFAVLRRQSRYLLERLPLHFTSSSAVYEEFRTSKRRRSGNPVGGLLAVGDPAYPADGTNREPSRDPQVRTALARRGKLPALPGTRAEVLGIAGLFQGTNVLVSSSATEERVKSLAPTARMLHFAVHGLLDERFPLNSGLALTIPEHPAEGQDNGLLQAWEIFESLRLDADLVTLSACDTALGKDAGGEGILGLTRAFQFAGARSVVASLWSVSDASTPELMRRFYTYLRDGKTKDEALRRAQVDLLRSGDPGLAHPYHWAAFQLYGGWE